MSRKIMHRDLRKMRKLEPKVLIPNWSLEYSKQLITLRLTGTTLYDS